MLKSLLFLGLLAVTPAVASETAATPKFGPAATPIFREQTFLREAPAPDYWTLSPYYLPQLGTSDCSVAAAAMAMNALRGLPEAGDQPLITEASLLKLVANPIWTAEVAQEGPGVRFEAFAGYLRQSLAALGLADIDLATVQPRATGPAELAAFRAALAANERSAGNVMLVYFNQGVVTGDWDGPHISPIGAYDSKRDRVLIMDVDREWYVPYWTDTATLLAAMVKTVAPQYGPLAGGSGGYYLLDRR